jgi:rSAM/selenodomain-associated transferase 1
MEAPPRLDGSRPAACLLLFTKPAVPGRVKTRLIGALSAEQAAELHAAFLDDLLARLLRRPAPFDLRLAWALEDGEIVPDAAAPGLRQEGNGLGERLFHALAGAAATHELVAAIGSDHPALPRAHVDEAFALLAAGAPLVLGPATDGGYYLVGARREALSARLFEDIPWSGPEVLARTLERCAELGLAAALLPPGEDCDTPADLARLAAALARDPRGCPATAGLLARWAAVAAGAAS